MLYQHSKTFKYKTQPDFLWLGYRLTNGDTVMHAFLPINEMGRSRSLATHSAVLSDAATVAPRGRFKSFPAPSRKPDSLALLQGPM
ncbi:hypothetical protein DWV00_18500 [Trinickia dinghuensis]|uniref:Uncharacterized protein n=1 Tax=Trinickia dinghuensis TaxID=2291023 RepID=A0A3D8JY01_9BURK|nr:hypothetical protein DWV00_18500 [Trinickia dinghuensis]